MGRINVKRKGSNAERQYRLKFIEIGFEGCVTARYGSRLLDDLGVDLMNLPILVQIKAGYPRLNHYDTIVQYLNTIHVNRKFIPHDKNKPFVLIHHLDVGKGKKREKEHSMVYMLYDDYNELCRITVQKAIDEELGDRIVKFSFDSLLKMIQCLTKDY